MVFADTSFLISLYGQDVNTPATRQQAAAHLDVGGTGGFASAELTASGVK